MFNHFLSMNFISARRAAVAQRKDQHGKLWIHAKTFQGFSGNIPTKPIFQQENEDIPPFTIRKTKWDHSCHSTQGSPSSLPRKKTSMKSQGSVRGGSVGMQKFIFGKTRGRTCQRSCWFCSNAQLNEAPRNFRQNPNQM